MEESTLRPLGTSKCADVLNTLRSELRATENFEIIRSELRNKELHVLDIGTGNGEFLPKIRDAFKKYGYDVFVIGIDNGDIMNSLGHDTPEIQKQQFIEDMNELLHDKYGSGFTMMYMDFMDAPDLLKRFDFVFVNAPDPYIDIRYFKAATELVKDEGIIIWRWHAGDDNDHRAEKIKKYVEAHDWKWIELETTIPEGDMALARRTIMVRKTEFTNSEPIIREAFSKLLQQFEMRSEIRKSA